MPSPMASQSHSQIQLFPPRAASDILKTTKRSHRREDTPAKTKSNTNHCHRLFLSPSLPRRRAASLRVPSHRDLHFPSSSRRLVVSSSRRLVVSSSRRLVVSSSSPSLRHLPRSRECQMEVEVNLCSALSNKDYSSAGSQVEDDRPSRGRRQPLHRGYITTSS